MSYHDPKSIGGKSEPAPAPHRGAPSLEATRGVGEPGCPGAAGRAVRAATTAEAGCEYEIERIITLLHRETGRDFSDYRANQIWRRVERRMGIHGLSQPSDYVRFLEANPQEREFLADEVLIGVTRFFRDPEAWAALRQQFLLRLQSTELAGCGVRAWVAGCSTGEEAYSLTILLHEVAAELRPGEEIPLKVFATDLDPGAIAVARRGRYSKSIAKEVPAGYLERYFIPEEGGYRISSEIRQRVAFALHDVLLDPPFKRLDLVSCRNVLIYLRPDRQEQLLRLFHYSLAPAGILFLGNAETTGNRSDLFTTVDWTSRIYRRTAGALRMSKLLPRRRHRPEAPVAEPEEIEPSLNLKALADAFLLECFAPAALLVNATGDILYVNGDLGRYLERPTGKTSWNMHALVKPAVRPGLGHALDKALREWKPVPVAASGVPDEGEARIVVHPIRDGALRGLVMIVFPRVTGATDVATTISALPSQRRAGPRSAFASGTRQAPDPHDAARGAAERGRHSGRGKSARRAPGGQVKA